MTFTIQLRRDTSANWTSDNPVLAQGEVGVETDTDKAKLGDGSTRWTSLAYWSPSGSTGSVLSVNGQTGTVTLTAAQVGADASGAAATAQSTAESFATSAVATETARAEAAEALLAPLTLPWQFRPESYGAKADGKVILDATITSGQLSTLTSQTANFTSADTGKCVNISQAGGSATASFFAATITYVNATTVTLSSPASNAVSGVGAVYGTDDTAAIQSAINAATSYAQASQEQLAEVLFQPRYYCVAGAAVIGGGTLGNGQLTLAPITATAGTKVYLSLKCPTGIAASPEHWLNPNISAPGAVLVGMRADGTYSTTYGPASVISGPVSGYGNGGGTFSNMSLTVEGLTILVPFNTTYGGMNLFGLGQANVKSFGYMPMAVPAAEAGVWPNGDAAIAAQNQYTAGLIMPVIGNNDVNQVEDYTSYSAYIHIAGCDHLTIKNMRTIFGQIGWLVNSNGGGGNNHGASCLNWSCEGVGSPLYALSTAGWSGYNLLGNGPVNIVALDLESFASGHIVAGDATAMAHLQGVCWFEDLNFPGHYYANLQANPTNLKMLDLTQTYGPVASPQAPPSSGTAWLNGYYRDAWVTLSATTITAVLIDSTTQNGLAGSPNTYSFLLPAGHSYTPTYTGTLTHTVTLL